MSDVTADREREVGYREAGWGRTTMSTFWHWLDPAPDDGSDRTSVCEVLSRYRGETIAKIARWETDPSVCELCLAILRARARGDQTAGRRVRLVALVPPGLPERLRHYYQEASKSDQGGYPFQETITQFRQEGVNRQFLAALLRYDALKAGKPWRKPLRWNDIDLDEVRELEGAERVRLLRERLPSSGER